MPTRTERLLAKFDNFIGWNDEIGSGEGRPFTRNFYTLLGRKMAIVDRDGHVRALGNSRWVIHEYDGKGNLLRRIPMRKTLREGERVIYGHAKAYEAYRAQPGYGPEPLQGGFECYN